MFQRVISASCSELMDMHQAPSISASGCLQQYDGKLKLRLPLPAGR